MKPLKFFWARRRVARSFAWHDGSVASSSKAKKTQRAGERALRAFPSFSLAWCHHDSLSGNEVRTPAVIRLLRPHISVVNTVWGGRLSKRFCNMLSESSTGIWAELQLPCCPSKQGELLENILQNLRNKWPPHPVASYCPRRPSQLTQNNITKHGEWVDEYCCILFVHCVFIQGATGTCARPRSCRPPRTPALRSTSAGTSPSTPASSRPPEKKWKGFVNSADLFPKFRLKIGYNIKSYQIRILFVSNRIAS